MTSQPYDDQNPFAKILRAELPCHKVYEDEKTLCFMDIMPMTDGHALVIPKAPSRNMLDIDPADLAAVMATAQKIARAQMKAFKADGIMVMQFNEPASGQTVYHTHVHLLPRMEGTKMRPHTGEMAEPTFLADMTEKLKAALV